MPGRDEVGRSWRPECMEDQQIALTPTSDSRYERMACSHLRRQEYAL